eukprot:CAMPEP_0114633588 /NCGR_PEP_ID=MMETSP0168-20121206/15531_1 /TAXON_ID=95228 ORGANISM="Vannella sp., Strain DIVA3 517/6/12" /NCGR_SAMPLE_ID=MMETSP0168 /ASSEMBLY_ACC=CAM_ASM_000044 /LENGTH=196 /DNA_ID=CAMNT_0001845241 /DNA_START=1 /DNA_END=591 /DNA_ORIENTATION=-
MAGVVRVVPTIAATKLGLVPLPLESSVALGAGVRLFRSAMPYSKTLDAEGEILRAWKELHEESRGLGGPGLCVVSTTPPDELERLTDGRASWDGMKAAGFHLVSAVIEKYDDDAYTAARNAVSEGLRWLAQDNAVLVSHCHSGFGRGSVVPSILLGKFSGLRSMEELLGQLATIDDRMLPAAKEKPRAMVATLLAE